jgi:hypothetical protein
MKTILIIMLLMPGLGWAQSFVYDVDYTVRNDSVVYHTNFVIHRYEGRSLKDGHFLLVDVFGKTIKYTIWRFKEVENGTIWKWYVVNEENKNRTITIRADSSRTHQYEMIVSREDTALFTLYLTKWKPTIIN